MFSKLGGSWQDGWRGLDLVLTNPPVWLPSERSREYEFTR